MSTRDGFDTGFADLNGASFKYEVQGEGAPLVLLHAGIADMRMWDPQIEAFAEHFKVVRFDMRGYGETRPVDETFSHSRDLSTLLGYLGIPSAHLLGCSMGGTTTIDFALEFPDKVRSIVLVAASPGGFEFEGDPPSAMFEASQSFKKGDIERAAELEVVVWVDGPYRTPKEVDPAIRELVREMDLIALENEALGLGQEQALDPPAVNRLRQINVPVQVIVGDLDDSEFVRAANFLMEEIQDARIVVMDGAAHLPNLERPGEFNDVVVDFLSSLKDV